MSIALGDNAAINTLNVADSQPASAPDIQYCFVAGDTTPNIITTNYKFEDNNMETILAASPPQIYCPQSQPVRFDPMQIDQIHEDSPIDISEEQTSEGQRSDGIQQHDMQQFSMSQVIKLESPDKSTVALADLRPMFTSSTASCLNEQALVYIMQTASEQLSLKEQERSHNIKQMQMQMQTLEAENETMRRNQAQLNNSLKKELERLDKSEARCLDLEGNLSKSERRCQDLESNLSRYKRIYKAEKVQRSTLEEQTKTLQKDLEHITASVEDQTAELEFTKKELQWQTESNRSGDRKLQTALQDIENNQNTYELDLEKHKSIIRTHADNSADLIRRLHVSNRDAMESDQACAFVLKEFFKAIGKEVSIDTLPAVLRERDLDKDVIERICSRRDQYRKWI